MNNWKKHFLDLIFRASTDLPEDVEATLRQMKSGEEANSRATFVLDTVLENVALARREGVPMCQDTGTLTFWLSLPRGMDPVPLKKALREAVREATGKAWLRHNTITEPGGESQKDNLSSHHPIVHVTYEDRKDVRARLLLKGGGCENMSRQYSLPDTELEAGRDLEGVRRCILDAAWQAQGNGCAPGILGVCIGGDRVTGYEVAKEQLLRPLPDSSPDENLARLENNILKEVQSLGIGPMGLGGKTTLLGLKIGAASRLPASYFVTVAYLCWAARRAEFILA